MHKLGEGEATMTKDEYTKMKQELEAWVQLNNMHFAECFQSALTQAKWSTVLLFYVLFSFQWVPGCVQENCPSAWSLPAKTVFSPNFKQRQKFSDFFRIRPGCEFHIMLTSLSHLSVGERGSGVYWQIVAHDLRPAAISTYAYQSSL